MSCLFILKNFDCFYQIFPVSNHIITASGRCIKTELQDIAHILIRTIAYETPESVEHVELR